MLSFVSRYFLISSLISSVVSWVSSRILFSLHVSVFFTDFFHSVNGWGCVPVVLDVWHRVSSSVACRSLSVAGS